MTHEAPYHKQALQQKHCNPPCKVKIIRNVNWWLGDVLVLIKDRILAQKFRTQQDECDHLSTPEHEVEHAVEVDQLLGFDWDIRGCEDFCLACVQKFATTEFESVRAGDPSFLLLEKAFRFVKAFLRVEKVWRLEKVGGAPALYLCWLKVFGFVFLDRHFCDRCR